VFAANKPEGRAHDERRVVKNEAKQREKRDLFSLLSCFFEIYFFSFKHHHHKNHLLLFLIKEERKKRERSEKK
jgi:hypothetical protein